MYKHDFINMAN